MTKILRKEARPPSSCSETGVNLPAAIEASGSRRIKITTDKLPESIRLEITSRIKPFTVALVGLRLEDGKVLGTQSGCGTLVVANQRRFVLTAAHVWRHVSRFEQIGITVRDGDNRFSIPTRFLNCRATPQPQRSEWGPDLALMEIPAHLVPDIESQHKAFYNLDQRRRMAVHPKPILREGAWVLVGAPAKQTSEADDGMTLRALVGLTSIFRSYKKGKHDYLDCSIDAAQPIRDLGGVSGGGLWHVDLRYKRSTKVFSTEQVTLEGVAFFQLPWVGDRGRVRCHGRRSIYRRSFELLG
jgi:hypothetical protein